MEKLLEILKKIKPGVDFENEKNLIDNHILESFDIIRLVTMVSDEFDVEITPMDIMPENFNSAESLMALIERLEDE